MKQILNVCLVIVCTLSLQANDHLYLHAHPSMGLTTIRVDGLNDYVQSYNAVENVPPHLGPLAEFKPKHLALGYGFGLMYTSSKPEKKIGFFSNVEYSFHHFRDVNRTEADIEYEMDLHMRQHRFHFDIGPHYRRNFFAGLSFGLKANDLALQSTYYYADGSRDMGYTYHFIGNFTGLSSDLEAGAYLAFRGLKFLHIQARANWQLGMFRSSDETMPLTDYDRYSYYSVDFPTTFPVANDESASLKLNEFYGPTYSLSIGFIIGAGKYANKQYPEN